MHATELGHDTAPEVVRFRFKHMTHGGRLRDPRLASHFVIQLPSTPTGVAGKNAHLAANRNGICDLNEGSGSGLMPGFGALATISILSLAAFARRD